MIMLLLVAIGSAVPGDGVIKSAPPPEQHTPRELVRSCTAPVEDYALRFTENLGQWKNSAHFISRTHAGFIGVEPTAVCMGRLDHSGKPGYGDLLKLEFQSASSSVDLQGEDEMRSRFNYFLGNDPSHWVCGARSFRRVRFHELYAGIDVILHADPAGDLEYDLVVKPGADLSRVTVRCLGARSLAVAADGALRIQTANGALAQELGHCWQEFASGDKRSVSIRWRLVGENVFGFEASSCDPMAVTLIDPVFRWATYLGSSDGPGGTGDVATRVLVDDQGDFTLTGWTDWYDFPTTPGAFVIPGLTTKAVFVSKLSGDGSELIYSSILGGAAESRGLALALDSRRRPTVVGWTGADDFPVTSGAFDMVRNSTSFSGFAFRLSEDGGSLVFSTFLEGTNNGTNAYAVAVTRSGASIIGGATTSSDFPTTSNAFMTSPPDVYGSGFVTRLEPHGRFLEWSTYLGGNFPDSVFALAIDDAETVTLTGQTQSTDFPTTAGAFETTYLGLVSEANVFVTRLKADGTGLIWSTFICGQGGDDYGQAVAIDRHGGVVVTGTTNSTDFPTTPYAFQPRFNYDPTAPLSKAFVTYLNPTGSALVYSTFLGKHGQGNGEDVRVDASGLVTVCGLATGQFPTTPGAFITGTSQSYDGFVTRLDPSGHKLYYSSFIGGPGVDETGGLAVTQTGRVCLVGVSSGGFPVTAGAFDTDYNGGATDAIITSMDLYLRGVEPLGVSTPSCHGPLIANATLMPESGNTRFAFYCSQCPENTRGWLLVGVPSAARFNYAGIRLWLDPARSIVRLPAQTNADGFVETSYPLTHVSSGTVFGCQYLFRNTQACAGDSAFCASNALTVTVQ
jgi:hypothetical protein